MCVTRRTPYQCYKNVLKKNNSIKTMYKVFISNKLTSSIFSWYILNASIYYRICSIVCIKYPPIRHCYISYTDKVKIKIKATFCNIIFNYNLYQVHWVMYALFPLVFVSTKHHNQFFLFSIQHDYNDVQLHELFHYLHMLLPLFRMLNYLRNRYMAYRLFYTKIHKALNVLNIKIQIVWLNLRK